MKEQLVSFETALLAKDKGFGLNSYNGFGFDKTVKKTKLAFFCTDYNNCAQPSQPELQRWLFENHNIWVSSTPTFSANEMLGVVVRISSWKFPYVDVRYDGDNVYEGLEKGLKEALELI